MFGQFFPPVLVCTCIQFAPVQSAWVRAYSPRSIRRNSRFQMLSRIPCLIPLLKLPHAAFNSFSFTTNRIPRTHRHRTCFHAVVGQCGEGVGMPLITDRVSRTQSVVEIISRLHFEYLHDPTSAPTVDCCCFHSQQPGHHPGANRSMRVQYNAWVIILF